MKRRLLLLLCVFMLSIAILSACSLIDIEIPDIEKPQWKEMKYKLIFDANGGTGTMQTVSAKSGEQITLPACTFSRQGYVFAGWALMQNEDAYYADGETYTFGDSNQTLYACWENNMFTITFDTKGGSSVPSITLECGATVTPPTEVPTKTGYTFNGWENLPATMPATNITVSAKWVVNSKYVLTFNTAGGSTISASYLEAGEPVTVPANPTKEGYTFDGWDKAIPSVMPANNVTINAKWKVNSYRITFDTNGGNTLSSMQVTYGATIPTLPTPVKENYVFAGWDKTLPATMPAQDITLTAQWEAKAFTVTINANGGNAIAPFTVKYGEQLVLPTPVYDGYDFDGWTETVPSTMPAQNLTFTAKWVVARLTVSKYIAGNYNNAEETRITGAVVCLSRNESDYRLVVLMDEETTQTVLVRFKMANCTYDTASATLSLGSLSVKIGDRITVTGTWASSAVDARGKEGLVTKEQGTVNIDYGKYQTAVTLETPDDFTNFAPDFSKHMGQLIKIVTPGASTSNSTAEGNYLRMYAKGDKIQSYNSKYYCCYVAGLKENGTYSWYNTKYGSLAKFNAGETPTAFAQSVIYAYIVSTGNTTYICTIPSMDAVYTVSSATITFNANGGSGTMSKQNVSTGISFALMPCTFTRGDYVFAGWSTKNSGEIEYADGATITVSGSKTLYAIWRERGEQDFVKECIDAIAKIDPDSPDATLVAKARTIYNKLPSLNARSQVTTYPVLIQAEYDIANASKYQEALKHIPEVIRSVAYAFYNQSSTGNVQGYYDQYNTRRNFNPLPEDATAEKALYLDCSSFVNSVYYYCFGENLLSAGTPINTSRIDSSLAEITQKGADYELLFYVKNPKNVTDSKTQQSMIAEIKATLQPGDIYNYYHGTGGHIMLYIGDGKFIHSTGSANLSTSAGSVDPATSVEKGTTDENKLGTVMIDSWDIIFTTTATPKSTDPAKSGTGNRYLFASDMTGFGFFRPTNATNGRFKDKEITYKALTRYVYDGLTFEKSCNRGFATSVLAGDQLTYTLKVQNLGKNAQGIINIVEKLPANTTFVSATEGGVYNSATNSIYWQYTSLDASSSKTLSYTLKVNDNAKVGTLINDNNTTVNGLLTNSTQHSVASRKITESQLATAVNAVSSKTYSDAIPAIKDVYAQLGMNILAETDDYTDVESVLQYVFNGTAFKPATTSKIYNYLVKGLYGGFSVATAEYNSVLKGDEADYKKYNYRARLVKTSYLEIGDIIVTRSGWNTDINNGTDYKAFLVASSSTVYGLTADGHFAKVSLPLNKTFATYLQTLTAYKAFAVLRPIASSTVKPV